jgi:competence protein ComEC
MVDVGHGSSALLELPDGYNIMIDGGGFSDNRVFDVGARIIAPLLWRKKIKTVDTLVLSHPNSDHLNGLIYIAEHFNVKNIWTNNETSNTYGYKKLMEVVGRNNIQMPGYKEIVRIHDINGVRFEVLSPPVDFIDRRIIESWRNINNNSLVIKVVFGAKSFLFPGDIKARAEGELVAAAGDRLKSTVLIAPHHGSRSSSTEPFLEKVSPEVVIISSRWKSRFGFPHPPVLKRYKERGCRIFGTARHGAITMSTDGQELMISPTITPNFS